MEDEQMTIVQVELQILLDQQGQAVEALAHIRDRSPAKRACRYRRRSSAAQDVENTGESLGIDPHAATVARSISICPRSFAGPRFRRGFVTTDASGN